MFDWEDLRHFNVFAQEKSLSAAARQLRVDHATVARRIAALESALRLKLVERRPRAYFLTADGERIAELVVRKLATVTFSLYAAASYLADNEGKGACIAYDTSMDDTPQHQWLLAQVGDASIVLRSNDLAVQAAAAAAGVGIAVLPDFMGVSDGRLTRLPHAGAALEREVWLALHSDLRHAPRIQAVVAFLAGCFER